MACWYLFKMNIPEGGMVCWKKGRLELPSVMTAVGLGKKRAEPRPPLSQLIPRCMRPCKRAPRYSSDCFFLASALSSISIRCDHFPSDCFFLASAVIHSIRCDKVHFSDSDGAKPQTQAPPKLNELQQWVRIHNTNPPIGHIWTPRQMTVMDHFTNTLVEISTAAITIAIDAKQHSSDYPNLNSNDPAFSHTSRPPTTPITPPIRFGPDE